METWGNPHTVVLRSTLLSVFLQSIAHVPTANKFSKDQEKLQPKICFRQSKGQSIWQD